MTVSVAVLGLSATPSAGDERYDRIEFPNVTGETTITGYILRSGTGGSNRWAVLAHACNGVLNGKGDIREKYSAMAFQLKENGVSSFLVDSHNSRGKNNICKTKDAHRSATPAKRIDDHIGAAAYIKKMYPDASIVLVGWGPGSLETMNTRNNLVSRTEQLFSAAALFYPPCRGGGGNSPYSPYAPMLIVVGENDNWEPAGKCEDLIREKSPHSAEMELKIYADTHHGFDNINQPVKEYKHASGRSTSGSNPASAQDAYDRIVGFFAEHTGAR
ncbi:MAG: dienelactone hydrolase family protein [Paracoccaceae bacterium]